MKSQTPPLKKCLMNRELSWLKFNERVLEEAQDERNPLGERLSFAMIFQNNLDEFFMVRVGKLLNSLDKGITDDKTGLTSAEQIKLVLARIKALFGKLDETYERLMAELAEYKVEICRYGSLGKKEKEFLKKHFIANILPFLSPQVVGNKQPFPFLNDKTVYAVASLKAKGGGSRLAIIKCAGASRLIPIPGKNLHFALMEDLILQFMPEIFARYKVESATLIRLMHNADSSVDAQEMTAEAFRHSMETLESRRHINRSAVKLAYRGKMADNVLADLCTNLGLEKKRIFKSNIPLDLSFLDALRDMLRDKGELFYPRRVPQQSPNIDPLKPMIPQIREKDLLLSYPYESIRPLIRLLNEAGRDPHVASIKMTLYRVAADSKIIDALEFAAENGKEVVVLVEFQARFDEKKNLGWARVLEEAGCRVIYGHKNMKVHSKLLLITRIHDGQQVEYITHIGTGNFNESTVKVYTDNALLTAAPEIGAAVANIFNCLSMDETIEGTGELLVSPSTLRLGVLKMLDAEIARARAGEAAYAGFKLNGLTDRAIIEKLIAASQAGVKIDLLVRGVCCLIGGVKGLTENITVSSIVGRFLEHSRIYIFGTEERRKVYISSADLMTRNTVRRIEVATPILDDDVRCRVEQMFFAQLRDTVKLRRQQPDGNYLYWSGEEEFNSQEYFYEMAYKGEWNLPAGDTPAAISVKSGSAE